MKEYATGPRKQLLAFFKKNKDRQYTVEEIEEAIKDSKISVSSIYRNVNKMSEDGALQRFSADGSRKFLYQYVGEGSCSEHLHYKCDSCGLIFHMDHKSMEVLLALAAQNDFLIDNKKTVLHGLCRDCRTKTK